VEESGDWRGERGEGGWRLRVERGRGATILN